jgi:D-amino-acid dehydrogenase
LKHITIVGSGIIGLCMAYYLEKEGHNVTVIDQSDISSGASFVNAGFVTPSHFIPLASPGIITKGLKMMFNSKSPFYIKPRLESDFLHWSLAFKKSATKKHVSKSIPILKDINLLSSALYADLKTEKAFDFQFENKGLLVYFKTPKFEEKEHKLAEIAINEGLINTKILSKEAVLKLEPKANLDVIGAVHYKCDSHMTPDEFMPKMQAYLKQKGVTFYSNEKVLDFDLQSQKVTTVITDKRRLKTDEVIISAGSWSPLITKKLGVKLLVQAGKGYRINIRRATGITIPSLLVEAKVGVTPMNGFTRLAGTMEVGGINQTINQKRVQAIAKSAEKYFTKLNVQQNEIETAACGLRPVSPDGLPFIGKLSNFKNVTIATGHAMMGWSLGPATGKLVSEIISNKKLSLSIDAFHPERRF